MFAQIYCFTVTFSCYVQLTLVIGHSSQAIASPPLRPHSRMPGFHIWEKTHGDYLSESVPSIFLQTFCSSLCLDDTHWVSGPHALCLSIHWWVCRLVLFSEQCTEGRGRASTSVICRLWFCWQYSRKGKASSYGSTILSCFEASTLILIMTAQSTSTQAVLSIPLFPHPYPHLLFCFPDDSHWDYQIFIIHILAGSFYSCKNCLFSSVLGLLIGLFLF